MEWIRIGASVDLGRNYLMKETGMVDAKLELNSLIKQTNLGVALALFNP